VVAKQLPSFAQSSRAGVGKFCCMRAKLRSQPNKGPQACTH